MSEIINSVEPTAPAVTGLSLDDLKFYKGFIEVASARGAVQPNEMQITGHFYKRLEAFLQAAEPVVAQAPGPDSLASGNSTVQS